MNQNQVEQNECKVQWTEQDKKFLPKRYTKLPVYDAFRLALERKDWFNLTSIWLMDTDGLTKYWVTLY